MSSAPLEEVALRRRELLDMQLRLAYRNTLLDCNQPPLFCTWLRAGSAAPRGCWLRCAASGMAPTAQSPARRTPRSTASQTPGS
eukprot:6778649-Lingulodinium_polyedra.AAC.1